MNGRRLWLQRLLGGAGGLALLQAARGAVAAAAPGVERGASTRESAGDAFADSAGEGAADPSREAALELAGADSPRRGRLLQFPRDHGAHVGTQIEWWYLTGSLAPATGGAVTHGFQVTFFRSRTGLAESLPGRFAPRHLLFAHAALTELATAGDAARHLHDQRIARWDGRSQAPTAHASAADADLAIGRWVLARSDTGSDAGKDTGKETGKETGQDKGTGTGQLPGKEAGNYRTRVDSSAVGDGFALDLTLARTQPLLLQGDRGFSRKGPLESQASHYYSEPHLAVSGSLRSGRRKLAVRGTAWLDHEWSDSLLPPDAEGWDWIGMNLFDGSALTAFRLRRVRAGAPTAAASSATAHAAEPAAVWAGGSFRTAAGALRSFGPDEVRFTPGRLWASRATGARYPVEWRVQTPAGEFRVRSLLDGQELDGSASNGAVYWEGLSELLDAAGLRVGLGYLEMTGYAGRLRLS